METRQKDKDNVKIFNPTKVREIIKCDSCGVPCCVYSMKKVGTLRGQMESLKLYLEKGYVCGNEVQSDVFRIRTVI